MLKWIDKIVKNLEEIILVGLMGIMPLICFWQVLCRYVLHFPSPWSEELMRVLFVWASFIGASYGVKHGAHLGVAAIVNLFPAKVRAVIMVLVNLACTVFSAYFFYIGAEMVIRQITLHQMLPVTRLSSAWATGSLPAGFFLMTIRFFLVTADTFIKNFMTSQQGEEGKA